ncbi:hypothetical protein FMT86_07835 [Clostridium perfringens]|uniref:hypothetical protein n=1 Tax=Clostridium perfringens TaxID=1502 RepID=UPI001CC9EEFE|nr:hypothetical protein [Clostridium perfringens]EGT0695729.1 hypothetical protein [Clostridium perfringens]EGT3603439.1 hypothetical protein [Clostridium perfringens]UBK39129.1 hypothetical protein KLF44_06880 [Clostridium perfringens]HBJ6023829.1 hypothetical protein [Clostridium perfringens]HBJ6107643.1 hypothetical protein [Clostridium perfringens]
MSSDKSLIELRDAFRNTADIIDELVALEEREKNGEDVEKECEAVMGRYLISFIKIQKIANKL